LKDEGASIKNNSHLQYDRSYFEGLHTTSLTYEKVYANYAKIAFFALEGLAKDARILDLGCGFGGLTKELVKNSGGVFSVDISLDGVLKTKSLNKDRARFVVGNGEFIPLKSEMFDCVIVSHVFEHLTDSEAERMQKEIYRILKPGGNLVIDQPFFGHHGIVDLALVFLLSSPRERRWFYNGFKDLIRARKKNPKADFHHLEEVLAPSHRRVYNVFLLIKELSRIGFSEFKFLQKKLFRILFFKSKTLFNSYVKFYLKSPEFMRRLFLIDIGGIVKAKK